MAKTPTEEGKRPRGKAQEAAVWVLMGMLILGLGGFGVTSFGGGVTKVASVGDTDVTTDDYARALQTQINALSQQFGKQISLQEAMAFGIDQQVLQSVLTRAALDNETGRVGISVGDEVVATEFMDQAATDLNAQLTKIRSVNPDSVILTTDVGQIALVLKQAAGLGMRPTWLTTGGSSAPAKLIDLAGPAAEGTHHLLFFLPWFPESMPAGEKAKCSVSDSAIGPDIAMATGVAAEPMMMSALSSVMNFFAFVTPLVGSVASSSTITLSFSPAMLVGQSLM